jgi:site-specific DNA-methyltransferase (adenine-specific)
MQLTDKIRVTQEDCMELMQRYPDKYFELAIVDPPYGIDVANMNMGIGKSKKASKAKNRKWINKDWDSNKPGPDFFEQLFRVSKNQIIWGGNYFDLPAFPHFIVWDKEIPDGLSFSDCELAWTSFNQAQRIFRHSVYLDKGGKKHPTQKPVALYKWLLHNYAKPGNKILDTHLGSGSIAIACHDYGFDLTACELDPDYYRDAVKRIKNHVAQIIIF